MSSGWYFWLAGTFIFCLIIVREWVQGGKCRSQARLDGKTVVITGANTGIGYETAKELSQRGAKIIMGSRNLEKSQKAAKSIVDLTGNSVHGKCSSKINVCIFCQVLDKHKTPVENGLSKVSVYSLRKKFPPTTKTLHLHN